MTFFARKQTLPFLNVGIFVAVGLVGTLSCDSRKLDSGVSAEQAYPAKFSAVRTRIFEPRCSRCHPAFLSYKRVMEYVVAGDAEASSIYHEMSEGRMPEAGSKLMDAEKAAIRTWIDQGAKND